MPSGERLRSSLRILGPDSAPAEYEARIAALSMMHLAACRTLLAAHGRHDHAKNIEAALDAIVEILAGKLGRDRLTQAMDWASGQLWACDAPFDGTTNTN